LSQPIYTCSSAAHRCLNCPILSAVSQLQFPELVIHVVHCL
jgi:hypothetical protein